MKKQFALIVAFAVVPLMFSGHAFASKKVQIKVPKIVTAQTRVIKGHTTAGAQVKVSHKGKVLGKTRGDRYGKYQLKVAGLTPKWQLRITGSKAKYRTSSKVFKVAAKTPFHFSGRLSTNVENYVLAPKKSQVSLYSGKKLIGKMTSEKQYQAQSFGIGQYYSGAKDALNDYPGGTPITIKIHNPKYSDNQVQRPLYLSAAYFYRYLANHLNAQYYNLATGKIINGLTKSTEQFTDENGQKFNFSVATFEQDGKKYYLSINDHYTANGEHYSPENLQSVNHLIPFMGASFMNNGAVAIGKPMLVPVNGDPIYYQDTVTTGNDEYLTGNKHYHYNPQTNQLTLWHLKNKVWQTSLVK